MVERWREIERDIEPGPTETAIQPCSRADTIRWWWADRAVVFCVIITSVRRLNRTCSCGCQLGSPPPPSVEMCCITSIDIVRGISARGSQTKWLQKWSHHDDYLLMVLLLYLYWVNARAQQWVAVRCISSETKNLSLVLIEVRPFLGPGRMGAGHQTGGTVKWGVYPPIKLWLSTLWAPRGWALFICRSFTWKINTFFGKFVKSENAHRNKSEARVRYDGAGLDNGRGCIRRGECSSPNSCESAANRDRHCSVASGESDAMNGNMINDISVGIIRSSNVRIDINIESILFLCGFLRRWVSDAWV